MNEFEARTYFVRLYRIDPPHWSQVNFDHPGKKQVHFDHPGIKQVNFDHPGKNQVNFDADTKTKRFAAHIQKSCYFPTTYTKIKSIDHHTNNKSISIRTPKRSQFRSTQKSSQSRSHHSNQAKSLPIQNCLLACIDCTRRYILNEAWQSPAIYFLPVIQ